MKASTPLLILSLAANAALVGVLWVRSNGSSRLSSEEIASSSSSPLAQSDSQTAAGAALSDKTHPRRNAWAFAEDLDLNAIKRRLEAAGYPAESVHAILMQLLSEQFFAQRTALIAERGETPYWQAGRTSSGTDPEAQAAANELSNEFSLRVRELFQGRVFLDETTRATAHQRYGALSDDKLERLQQVENDYNQLRSKALATQGWTGTGTLTAANQERLTLLDQEHQADIAAILTPDELFEFHVRSSPTASRLRSQLAGFSPTEDEFRAIFAVQRKLDEQSGAAVPNFRAPSIQSSADQEAALQALTLQLEGVLSPERLADFTLANDPAYSTVARLTARLGLPLSATRQVIAVQQEVQPQMAALRANRQLTPQQREVQLKQVLNDATERISDTLGAQGYEAYLEYGGQWLRPRLTPTRVTR